MLSPRDKEHLTHFKTTDMRSLLLILGQCCPWNFLKIYRLFLFSLLIPRYLKCCDQRPLSWKGLHSSSLKNSFQDTTRHQLSFQRRGTNNIPTQIQYLRTATVTSIVQFTSGCTRDKKVLVLLNISLIVLRSHSIRKRKLSLGLETWTNTS